MNQKAKRVVLSALTAVTAAASLTVATTTQASAINLVSCNSSEFLTVGGHDSISNREFYWTNCYANAGEANIDGPGTHWVDYISTGNNQVQWHGDGRWQPDAPINKWTYFVWDHNPGGVNIDRIRIL